MDTRNRIMDTESHLSLMTRWNIIEDLNEKYPYYEIGWKERFIPVLVVKQRGESGGDVFGVWEERRGFLYYIFNSSGKVEKSELSYGYTSS